MTTTPTVNKEAVIAELSTRGLDIKEIGKNAQQIVLFGSWSVGLQRADSDIDLLCVGSGKRDKSAKIDVVWISSTFSKSPKWRQSELANHIIRYGVWLKGSNEWGQNVQISPEALDFKRALIRSRSRVLLARWDHLSDEYRAKHVIKLRRDIQRLAIMKAGNAVPTSPQLDEAWCISGFDLEALLQSIGELYLVSPSLHLKIGPLQSFRDWRDWPSTAALAGGGQ